MRNAEYMQNKYIVPYSATDPGFPVGGRRPPTRALFGGNVCENKRIWSHWVPWGAPLDPGLVLLPIVAPSLIVPAPLFFNQEMCHDRFKIDTFLI